MSATLRFIPIVIFFFFRLLRAGPVSREHPSTSEPRYLCERSDEVVVAHGGGSRFFLDVEDSVYLAFGKFRYRSSAQFPGYSIGQRGEARRKFSAAQYAVRSAHIGLLSAADVDLPHFTVDHPQCLGTQLGLSGFELFHELAQVSVVVPPVVFGEGGDIFAPVKNVGSKRYTPSAFGTHRPPTLAVYQVGNRAVHTPVHVVDFEISARALSEDYVVSFLGVPGHLFSGEGLCGGNDVRSACAWGVQVTRCIGGEESATRFSVHCL